MDYEKFAWKPRPGVNVSNDPRSIESSFGDGYSQVAPDGLNYNQKEYQLKIRVIGELEKKRILEFLERHGSHKAFYIYSWSRNKDVLVRTKKFTEDINSGAGYTDLSLTVKEVSL